MSSVAATSTAGGRAAPSLPDRIKKLVSPLASMRITVVTLILGAFLVFAGTIAQIETGIWSVVSIYFHSFFVWIPFDIFLPRGTHVAASIPFPGGWTIGGVLLINLIAAFIVRLQWRRDRIGLLISHLGIITMLCGEIVTGVYADEGHMSIDEGSWSGHTEDIRHAELVFVDRSGADKDVNIVVPEHLIKKPGVIANALLPAVVDVQRFMVHSRLELDPQRLQNQSADAHRAVERPDVGGTSGEGVNMPSMYAKLHDPKTGKSLGVFLFSTWAKRPTPITIAGKRYDVALRFRRKHRSFQLHLVDFTFKRYPGTDIPASYSSKVRLVDKANQVDREVLIWMNHPLRYAGETFYQASFRPDERGTVLQVVRNPGWLIPYVSCGLVTFGLLLHFMLSLTRFLRRRSA